MFNAISVSHCLQIYITIKNKENQFIISIISDSIFLKAYEMYTNSQKFYGLFHKFLRFSSMKFVFTFCPAYATM